MVVSCQNDDRKFRCLLASQAVISARPTSSNSLTRGTPTKPAAPFNMLIVFLVASNAYSVLVGTSAGSCFLSVSGSGWADSIDGLFKENSKWTHTSGFAISSRTFFIFLRLGHQEKRLPESWSRFIVSCRAVRLPTAYYLDNIHQSSPENKERLLAETASRHCHMWERVEQGAYLTTISIVRKIVYVRRGFMEGDPKELKAGDGPLREEVSKESFFLFLFLGEGCIWNSVEEWVGFLF